MAEQAKIGAGQAKTGTATAAPSAPQKVFPPLDATTFAPQLVWLAITFGFLYLMLSRMLLPRVGEVLTERAERIGRDLAEAERLRGETERALAAYEDAMAGAKGRAGAIARDTRARLAAETERERTAVDAEVAAKLAAAEQRIAADRTAAMASVGGIATEAASAIVARLTGVAPSAGDVGRVLVAAAGRK